jgi:hypothetical protein
MTLISYEYGTVINSLFTDKSHSMKSFTWIFKIVTKYFAMKHESKPRDYKSRQDSSSNRQDSSSNRQDSSLNRQDSTSKKQNSTSNTEADSHDGQQKRQKKRRCQYCDKIHPGICHTIMNNLNFSKPIPSNNTKP